MGELPRADTNPDQDSAISRGEIGYQELYGRPA